MPGFFDKGELFFRSEPAIDGRAGETGYKGYAGPGSGALRECGRRGGLLLLRPLVVRELAAGQVLFPGDNPEMVDAYIQLITN